MNYNYIEKVNNEKNVLFERVWLISEAGWQILIIPVTKSIITIIETTLVKQIMLGMKILTSGNFARAEFNLQLTGSFDLS